MSVNSVIELDVDLCPNASTFGKLSRIQNISQTKLSETLRLQARLWTKLFWDLAPRGSMNWSTAVHTSSFGQNRCLFDRTECNKGSSFYLIRFCTQTSWVVSHNTTSSCLMTCPTIQQYPVPRHVSQYSNFMSRDMSHKYNDFLSRACPTIQQHPVPGNVPQYSRFMSLDISHNTISSCHETCSTIYQHPVQGHVRQYSNFLFRDVSHKTATFCPGTCLTVQRHPVPSRFVQYSGIPSHHVSHSTATSGLKTCPTVKKVLSC